MHATQPIFSLVDCSAAAGALQGVVLLQLGVALFCRWDRPSVWPSKSVLGDDSCAITLHSEFQLEAKLRLPQKTGKLGEDGVLAECSVTVAKQTFFVFATSHQIQVKSLLGDD